MDSALAPPATAEAGALNELSGSDYGEKNGMVAGIAGAPSNKRMSSPRRSSSSAVPSPMDKRTTTLLVGLACGNFRRTQDEAVIMIIYFSPRLLFFIWRY